MRALDISSNNHTGQLFNWQEVKAAGYDTVYVKATQGTKYTNPYLLMDTRDAHNAGLAVGVYHFYDETQGTPAEQATHFVVNGIGQVDKGICTLLPVFDYEQGSPTATVVNQFVDVVPGGCALYVDRSFYAVTGMAHAKWVWLADPNWNGELLDSWVTMVQTGTAIVPGIPGVQCDIDDVIGDITIMVPGGPKLGGPITSAAICNQGGYWLAGSDGGVFAFGCSNYGNMAGKPHSGIIAIVPSLTGKGYALIGSDGGVFAFGDFHMQGSVPGLGIGPA